MTWGGPRGDRRLRCCDCRKPAAAAPPSAARRRRGADTLTGMRYNRCMNRNLWLLATAQGLFLTNN
ncbi:MAG: hypothetical protein RMK34_10505, partial [Tepidimonas sp.]|uniref:hypothetical protein n=1 Tax=Tepidimonas sp. TaxID=2002775 RepID=UPI00298EE8D1